MDKTQGHVGFSRVNKCIIKLMMNHVFKYNRDEYFQALLSSKWAMTHFKFSNTDVFQYGEIFGFASTEHGTYLLEAIKKCLTQGQEFSPVEINIDKFPDMNRLESFVDICEIFGVSVSLRLSPITNRMTVRLTSTIQYNEDDGESDKEGDE